MDSKLTLQELECFLNDHYSNSTTTILEEGKEKEDLYKIAEAKGIKIQGSKDLAIFKNVYAFPDIANKNGARLPKKELLRALPGIVGKPVNLEHERKYVVGFYIDYSYKQKTDEVIAYGILFKSNFPEEYADIQEAFKKGKLNTSYEIWCPRDKRTLLPDGTYRLDEQEIAGGAILIKNEPAFDGAKVLNMAKKQDSYVIDGCNLEFASKYETNDMITANTKNSEPIIVPKINVVDFNVKCPDCSTNNWNVTEETAEFAKITCTSCSHVFKAKFSEVKISDDLPSFNYCYEGSVNCYQCSHPIHFSQFVKTNEEINRKIKCLQCGLEFPLAFAKKEIKTISSIEKIIEETTNASVQVSQGDNKMENIVAPITEPITEPVVATVEPIVEPVIAAVEPVVEAVTEPVIAKTEPIIEPVVEPVAVIQEPIQEPTVVVPTVIEQPVLSKEEMDKEKYRKMLRKHAKKARELKKEMKHQCMTKASVDEELNSYKDILEGYEVELATLKETSNVLLDTVKKDADTVKAFYQSNAKKIYERRQELNTYSNGLTDEQILDDKDFEIAKLNKEKVEQTKNNLNASSVTVGDKDRIKGNELDDYYVNFRKKVDSVIGFNRNQK